MKPAKLDSMTLLTLILIPALILLSTTASASTLFSEDFESYDVGSDLSGQGGWEGGGWDGYYPIYVGDCTQLGSKCADGRLNLDSAGDAYTRNLFDESLSSDFLYILSFDAYAYTSGPNSHGSAVGFHMWNYNWATSWLMEYTLGGWQFDARRISNNSNNFEIISGGFGTPVSMSIFIDGLNMEVYGLADFGSSGIYETTHYDIDPSRLVEVDGVMLSQDYRGGRGGGEFDNILVTSTPVPEPSTMLLLCAGLIGLAGANRKRGRN